MLSAPLKEKKSQDSHVPICVFPKSVFLSCFPLVESKKKKKEKSSHVFLFCYWLFVRRWKAIEKSNYGETTWNLGGLFFRLQFGKPWRKVLIISTLSLPKSIPLVDAASHHTLCGCLTVRLIRRFVTLVSQCNADIHCGRGWPLYAIYLKCLLCFYLLETAPRGCFFRRRAAETSETQTKCATRWAFCAFRNGICISVGWFFFFVCFVFPLSSAALF